MRYVKQNVASEDTVQLFDAAGSPVNGLTFGDLVLVIRKEGASGFTTKILSGANFFDRSGVTPGNYAILFSAADFDTLGNFRYRITPVTPGTFVGYEDGVVVVEELPSIFSDPPSINGQGDTPPGILPNPVFQGGVLTINGSDLAGALEVRIKPTAEDEGTALVILTNTNDQITATVPADIPLGDDQIVEVSTPGGTDSGTVSVVLNPASIPGLGLCNITGQIFNPTGQPKPNVGVKGQVLDMPNILDGIAWTDEPVSVVTDANGRFSISLPRKRRCEIMIREARYRREFIVPDLDTADLFREIPEF
jgi:hypothetical protein